MQEQGRVVRLLKLSKDHPFVLTSILLNRLKPTIAEENLPESQCSLRANRVTTDMMFVLQQLQEKCHKQNKGLYTTFVDLNKALNTVNRKGLWLFLECLGCPPKFLEMVIQLHEDQRGQDVPAENVGILPNLHLQSQANNLKS